jgi:hypothetical protein
MASRSPGAPPVVVDMSDKDREKKKEDALFGPNIGVVSSGPAWTNNKQKKVVADELTPEVVKSWIAKSKEVRSYPFPPSFPLQQFFFSFFIW